MSHSIAWPLPADWPRPEPEALVRSAALCARLRAELAGGAMPFDSFMERVLYTPELGYYSGPNHKFGAGGDFVTAPEISPLFSACLAAQSAEVLTELGGGDVLEPGAGSGVMAADMLLEFERLACLPEHYLILELSGELRARQQQSIEARAPHLASRVSWLDRLPDSFTGVVVANEVLDALPVKLMHLTGDGLRERCVVPDGDGFGWSDEAPTPRLLEYAADLGALPERVPAGYVSEAHVAIRPWIASLAEHMARGAMLLVDYGYTRADYFRPDRHMGTLMCHYRHRAHADPLTLVGLQDLTAYVDFTAVAEAADAAGMAVAGFTSQTQFLLNSGITQRAEATPAPDLQAQLELARQIKLLTLPGEMGERFKVMALSKGVDHPPSGFGHDLRGRL